MSKLQSHILPYLAGTLAAVFWGAWQTATKYSIINTLGVLDIIFIRFATASIIAIPIIIKFGPTIKQNNAILKIAVITFCSGAGYVYVASSGFRFAPASYGSIIPIGITFFSIATSMAINRHLDKKLIASLLCILAGFAVFMYQIYHSDKISSSLGIFLFVLAGGIFSIYNTCAKHWNINPIHLVALVSVYSALAFAPIYFYNFYIGETKILTADINEIIFQIIYQGIIVAFLALLLFSYAGARLGSAHASVCTIFTPISATILSVIVLNEVLHINTWIAIFIMITGMLIGFWPKKAQI